MRRSARIPALAAAATTALLAMLLSSFRLDHESGESRDFLQLPWPILEGNGRPFDKALAGALTTQQAYFVRDLLQMPKEDENEIDRRNDKETVEIEVDGRRCVLPVSGIRKAHLAPDA